MSLAALYFEEQSRQHVFLTTVGVRRINYWYTRDRNCGELMHFNEYGYDFHYCLIPSTRLNFPRNLVLNHIVYGCVYCHRKSQQWRVTILEDFLPLKFRAIGLSHEGYHLKQRILGRPISRGGNKEEGEALCEEMKVATLEGLVDEYIEWTTSVLPSRVRKLKNALDKNKRKQK